MHNAYSYRPPRQNYGQTLTIWDKWGRTFYKDKKKYDENSFSW